MKFEEGAGTANPGRRLFEVSIAALLILPALALLTTARPWLAFLPLLGLVGFLVIGRIPRIAYYLLVFLVPFGAYRNIAGGEQQVFRIPWLVALVLLLVLLAVDMPRREFLRRLRSNLWRYLGVFLVVSAVSTLLSDYPLTAAKNLALLPAAVGYIVFGIILIDREGLRRTLPAVIITSVSLGSLTAVLGYYFKIAAFADDAGTTTVRGIGFSSDPNNMSLMIIFSLPLVSFFILHAKSTFWRLCLVLILLLNLAAVVSTFSRGGFLMLLVCCCLLLFEHGRRLRPKHFGFVLLAAALGVLLVFAAVPAEYWERQQTIALGTKADRAIGRRASYVLVARDAVLNHPFLGSGPGSFIDIFSSSRYAHQYSREQEGAKSYRRYAHNTYLEVVVGTGLLGLLVFLLLLRRAFGNFSAAARAFRERRDPWMEGLVRSYRISFVMVALYLLIFSDLFHKYLLLSLALSQVVLSVVASEPRRSEESLPPPGPDRLPESPAPRA